MEKPSPTFSSETVAVVSSFLAVRPAPPSCAESAMVKQPACAAARSSSGLVPMPFSKRVENEYCVSLSVPLSVEMDPFPVFRSPCQTAEALRCILRLSFGMTSAYVRCWGFGFCKPCRGYVGQTRILPLVEDEKCSKRNEAEPYKIIPLHRLAQIGNRK